MIPNNDLGKSYVVEVQHGGKHILLNHTDVEDHEHLTNHFNEKLNTKIFETFTELFSHANVDSIQETCPKINVYSKVISQYVKEINMEYGLNLKFKKLEALEVGLWARTFQVAGNEEVPQLPKRQQSEPPKTQQPQHTSIPNNEWPVIKQQVENGQKTSVATQWSYSTPIVSPIVGERNGPLRQQVGQGQRGIEHANVQGLCQTQININGRFSQPSPVAQLVLTQMFHIVVLQDRS